MKVLIADLFSQSALDSLTSEGIPFIYNHQLNGDSLKSALISESPQILVVRSTKVTADMISSASSLEFIIRAGAGVDNIDTQAASQHSIFVANCPGKNSVAVAELVLGHIISVDRRLAENNQLLKAGKWNKGAFSEAAGLKGRTIGIVGLGAIGREVAIRAKSFGLELYGLDQVHHPFLSEIGVNVVDSLDELCRVSDFITFHVPCTPETKGIINSALVAKCKDNVVIINTSRGDIVNEAELLHELNQRPGLWYACDVFQGEPAGKEADFVHQLAQHPRVYGSHHIGASTKQAENAIGLEALRMILQYAKTSKVDAGNLVNMQQKSSAKNALVIRHSGNALTRVLVLLAERGCKVQEVENKAFKGGVAYTATVNVDCESCDCLPGVVAELRGGEGIINVSLVNLG